MACTEEYVVKFWLKNPETKFIEQKEQSVFLTEKGMHTVAEKQILAQHRQQEVSIISVTYQ